MELLLLQRWHCEVLLGVWTEDGEKGGGKEGWGESVVRGLVVCTLGDCIRPPLNMARGSTVLPISNIGVAHVAATASPTCGVRLLKC